MQSQQNRRYPEHHLRCRSICYHRRARPGRTLILQDSHQVEIVGLDGYCVHVLIGPLCESRRVRHVVPGLARVQRTEIRTNNLQAHEPLRSQNGVTVKPHVLCQLGKACARLGCARVMPDMGAFRSLSAVPPVSRQRLRCLEDRRISRCPLLRGPPALCSRPSSFDSIRHHACYHRVCNP